MGSTKKIQAPARVRTRDLVAGQAISEVHFTQWSGDKVEFWQNLLRNASQIMIFLPHLCGRKIKKTQRPREPKGHPQRQEERRRRRKKHCVVPSEPEKCLEKPKSDLQPDNGFLQEPRRLDENDIKQADCG